MLYIPTLHDIESLQVGNMAMDCFGRQSEVSQITIKSTDVNGKAFVLYYTNSRTGNGQISMSMKEDELVRHVGTSAKFTSYELDDIEKDMLSKGERVREL